MSNGQIIIANFNSEVLKNNPLQDPFIRQLPIYLPPGYAESKQNYPVIFLLGGFMNGGIKLLNREAFSEAIDERLNRLMSTNIIQPMIVVMPDCFTYYGGSQYLNSSATGHYESYIINELVPYIKQTYRTAEPTKWTLMGKSSGGYGAMALGMRHADMFGNIICHSGDMGFEYCYQPDFPDTVITLEKHQGIVGFMKHFYHKVKKDGRDIQALNTIAMAAAYSPNPTEPCGIEFPFDLHTGAIRPDIWQQWLQHDPVHMLEDYQTALKKLNIFFDCGIRDECRLFAGARMLSTKMKALNIKHTYEEFDDTHRNTNYRYDRSLQFISDLL